MFSTTAFGNIGHFVTGGRLFRTLAEKQVSRTEVATTSADGIQYVEWTGDNDPENPKNWSFAYKCFVTFIVCVMTVFVYLGSSVVVPGIPEIREEFGVSEPVAALSISLFVWGYGLGPMVLSPITEIARIGRNWPYVISIGLFVIMQVPTGLCNNIPGYLVLRFIAGLLGSPVLATGGATMADIWNLDGGFMNGIACWSYAACGGPGLGPLLSGFAVQERGWHWTFWPLLCGTGLTWLVVFFLMPETSADAVLAHRAAMLRRKQGNANLRSRGELRDAQLTLGMLTYATLYRPLYMTFTEPVLFFSNLYIAYVYGITYCFFEAFPLTFQGRHGFSLGQSSSAYVTGWIVCVIALLLYCWYNQQLVLPWFRGGKWKPEYRMHACFAGGILFPASLFWFGWTSFASVPPYAPLAAYGVFQCAVFLLFQGFLGYLGEMYPVYTASAYASNGLFRALAGGAFPLFSTQMFERLTIQGGCSLLGGLAVLLLPITLAFYMYGGRLRQMSRMAGSSAPMEEPLEIKEKEFSLP